MTTADPIGKRIRDRRKELGLTMKELSEKSGIALSSISGWEQGYTTSMKHTNAKALAKALDITPMHLLGWDLEEEITEILNVQQLSSHDNYLASNIAGVNQFFEGANFSVTVRDHSLASAGLFPGACVLCSSQTEVENGQVAAVLINGEAMLRRVLISDEYITFKADSPELTIICAPNEDRPQIIGRALTAISEVI